MSFEELTATAKALVARGRGILAADESSPTIQKRFDTIGVQSTEENRRDYRELLFTTDGAGDFISGVILFDETLRQSASDGRTLAQVLTDRGMIPGIKVDQGAKALAFHDGEKVTEGLDGLRDRCKEYYELGARFSKWRAVIAIESGIPSAACISANAHALARYAALSQEAGLVPIVEPEVLMDGDHTIGRCEEVSSAVFAKVFEELNVQGVNLEGMLLKPNMIISGKECAEQASVDEVAKTTIDVLQQIIPHAVPGIVFLSGGQSEAEATTHLNAMNALGEQPWELSFSYGRALQASVLQAWMGKSENVGAAQQAFLHRAKCNGAARYGKYSSAMEAAA